MDSLELDCGVRFGLDFRMMTTRESRASESQSIASICWKWSSIQGELMLYDIMMHDNYGRIQN